MPTTNSVILLPDEIIDGLVSFAPDNLNPIDTSFPVGNAQYVCHVSAVRDKDAERIALVDGGQYIELGKVWGKTIYDVNNPNDHPDAQVSGHFYYQNNQLFGLDDDTPDAVVDSSDALYDMSSYLADGSTGYEQRFIYSRYPLEGFNIPMHIFNAYTTPCDTFSVGLTTDTVICKGDSVQLQAWGNTHYKWLYGANISDTTISNPYVSPDSSQLYTVLINDGNGCGKTANVFVEVLESPSITQLLTQETTCGLSEGSITISQTQNTSDTVQYILNAGVPQESNIFNNLPYGYYNVAIQNSTGCMGDTTVYIPYNIITQADFTASPNEGYAPLNVSFTNLSSNASNYVWSFGNNNSSTEEHPNTIYENTGSYEVELIAYLNDTICADTSSLFIHVYSPITAILPNVVTPNADGVNDIYTIQIKGAVKLTGSIKNRWGNVIQPIDKELSGFQETVELWQPENTPAGTYFYELEAEDALGEKQIFQGFVEVRN
mgnify:CR=1 FL=1